MINKPTYLIAELNGDVVPLVMNMRKIYNPGHNQWPVDITLVGSSGLGTFKNGQDIYYIIETLTPIIEKHKFNTIEFLSVNKFPGTGIYFLTPERKSFDDIHNAISQTSLLFNLNPFPYNPHCTLRSGSQESNELDTLFFRINLPVNSFIECFSLYQPEINGGNRIHKFC